MSLSWVLEWATEILVLFTLSQCLLLPLFFFLNMEFFKKAEVKRLKRVKSCEALTRINVFPLPQMEYYICLQCFADQIKSVCSVPLKPPDNKEKIMVDPSRPQDVQQQADPVPQSNI